MQAIGIISKTRRWFAVVGLTALMVNLSYAQPIDQDKVNQIKAAYIFHMAQLTTWPDAHLDEVSTLRVIFLGDETEKLAQILASKTSLLLVQGHRLEVSQISDASLAGESLASFAQAVATAHILYVGDNVTEAALALCRQLPDQPLLIAGDGQVIPQHGGMVGFYVDEHRVRINVNLENVEHATLKMSAEFLQHVAIVGPHEGSH